MSHRSLILGGTGFIGLHLARRLTQVAGPCDEIVLADNLSRGHRDSMVEELLTMNRNVRLLELDLSRQEAYAALGDGFDHVYLLASMVGVRCAETRPEDVLKINTTIILGALEWMASSGSRRLFFSSTSENYAGGYEFGIIPIPTPERVPLVISEIGNPRFSYAVTKIWGEAASIFYGAHHGFTSIIGRYHNVYGPRMGYGHVIPELSQRILTGEEPLKVMSPDQTRAFCYITDAVEATRLLMEAQVQNGLIVNIGNDREEIQIGALAQRLLRLAGRPPVFETRPAPRGSVPRRAPAIDLLRELTGFEPAVPIDSGLAETFAWYRQHPSDDTRVGCM